MKLIPINLKPNEGELYVYIDENYNDNLPLPQQKNNLWLINILKPTSYFGGCSLNISDRDNGELTRWEVHLPNTIIELGSESLNSGLYNSINLPDSLVDISSSLGGSSITNINIPTKYLFKLDNNCFSECSELPEITIPEGIEIIRADAFYKNRGLSKINFSSTIRIFEEQTWTWTKGYGEWTEYIPIPWIGNLPNENLIYLGKDDYILFKAKSDPNDPKTKTIEVKKGTRIIAANAFSGNTYVTEIKLPETITHINSRAFEGCTNLKTITIPKDLVYLGYKVFSGTGLTFTDEGNSRYLVDKEGNYYLVDLISDNTEITEFYINKNTKIISSYLSTEKGGDWKNIKNVLLNLKKIGCNPSDTVGVEEKKDLYIGDFSFCGVSDLTDISDLYKYFNIKYIGEGAFMNTGISTIELPEGLDLSRSMNVFSRSAENLLVVDEISINSKLPVGTYTDGLFRGYEFTKVTLNESAELAFGCLSNCTIDDLYVKKTKLIDGFLGNSVFFRCNVKNITFSGSDETHHLQKLGKFLFYENSTLETVIFNSDNCNDLTVIDEGAFYNCRKLTTVYFPGNIERIENKAFYGCSSLVDINKIDDDDTNYLPQNLKYIGEECFKNCSSLENITIPAGINEIGDLAFSGCSSLTEISIPEGVIKIPRGCFENCSSLTKIYIPDTVIEIEGDAFKGCTNLTDIYVSGEVTWYNINFKNEYSNPIGEKSSLYINGKLITSVEIPSTVIKVNNFLFNKYKKLTSLTLHNNIISIGEYSLSETGLTTLTLSSQTQEIKEGAFKDCISLIYVKGDNLSIIGPYAFYNCKELMSSFSEDLSGENLKYIGNSAFKGCVKFNKGKINFGANLERIGAKAFEGVALTEINLRNSKKLSRISESTFYNCTELKTVSLPDNLIEIKSNAFKECTGITTISFPTKLSEIGKEAFMGCSSLTEIKLNGKVKLRRSCFKGCSKADLDENSINNIVYIEPNALHNTKWYNEKYPGFIIINNGLYNYKGTTGGTLNLSSLENVHYICNEAFKDFTSTSEVSEVILPPNLKLIGTSAFEGCTKLQTIKNLYKVSIIGDRAFYGCTGLTEIILSNPEDNSSNITHIGYSAFEKCGGDYGLSEDILLGKNIEHISSRAFFDIKFRSSFNSHYNIFNHTGISGFRKEYQGLLDEIIKLKFIGDYAFSGTYIYEDLFKFAKNLEHIGEGAFDNSTVIQPATVWNGLSLPIPPGIKATMDELLENPQYDYDENTVLGRAMLKLPNSIKYIGNRAFMNMGVQFLSDTNKITSHSNQNYIYFDFSSFKFIPKLGGNEVWDINKSVPVWSAFPLEWKIIIPPHNIAEEWINNPYWREYDFLFIKPQNKIDDGENSEYYFKKNIIETGDNPSEYTNKVNTETFSLLFDGFTNDLTGETFDIYSYSKEFIANIDKDTYNGHPLYFYTRIYKLNKYEKLTFKKENGEIIWDSFRYLVFREKIVIETGGNDESEGESITTSITTPRPGGYYSVVRDPKWGIQFIPAPPGYKSIRLVREFGNNGEIDGHKLIIEKY